MRHRKLNTIDKVKVPEGTRGNWKVERFEITREQANISLLRAAINNRPREFVDPGTYTRLVHRHRGIIMSDTPAEMNDHANAVMRARGDCLINGLGLGMVLGAILKKPEVVRVTVVEIDRDVIALVGPSYAKDSRVGIVRADAYTWRPPSNIRFDWVWHDIWDSVCADNLDGIAKLKRKYAKRAEWQGAWCEGECKRMQQHSREDT